MRRQCRIVARVKRDFIFASERNKQTQDDRRGVPLRRSILLCRPSAGRPSPAEDFRKKKKTETVTTERTFRVEAPDRTPRLK